jgi:hypothetical protein
VRGIEQTVQAVKITIDPSNLQTMIDDIIIVRIAFLTLHHDQEAFSENDFK